MADDQLRAVQIAVVILEPGLAALGRAVLGQIAVPHQPPEDLPIEIGRGDRLGLEHVGYFAALRGQADLQLLLGLGQLLGAGDLADAAGVGQDEPAIDDLFQHLGLGHRQQVAGRLFLSWKTRSIIRWTSATSTGSSPTVAATADSGGPPPAVRRPARQSQRKPNSQTRAESRFMGPVL